MLSFVLPDAEEYRLSHLCLDLNGTIALDGRLVEGVAERIAALRATLEVHLLTAGTHGGIVEVERALGVQAVPIARGAEKETYVQALGADGVVAIGNGRNDALMLTAARLGICVLGPEGAARGALMAADVVAPSPQAALSLLLHPDRLRATLRR
jgi:soluble P-type ATPase